MVVTHDGNNIPTINPKDPNDFKWVEFSPQNMADDETITSFSILINDQVVNVGETFDGLRLETTQSNGTDVVKAQFSGGNLYDKYRVTFRFSTQYIPQADRSCEFMVKEL